MPIYEYRCQDCGTVFEKIVPLGTDAIPCAKCSSTHVERVLSTFAVQTNNYSPCGAKSTPCSSCGMGQQGMCGDLT